MKELNFEHWPTLMLEELAQMLTMFEVSYLREMSINLITTQVYSPGQFVDLAHWPQDIVAELGWILGAYNVNYIHDIIFKKLKTRRIVDAYKHPSAAQPFETYGGS